MVQNALQNKISEYIGRGYEIRNQNATSATLVEPKRFGLGWAIFWFLWFGFGVLVYFAYHMWGKKEKQVYVTADDKGNVSETRVGVA